MVLEPWITPSIFYQFLGGNETTTAMVSMRRCSVMSMEDPRRKSLNSFPSGAPSLDRITTVSARCSDPKRGTGSCAGTGKLG